MKRYGLIYFSLLILLPLTMGQAASATEPAFSAMSTLSRRAAKPEDRVELVVTVRAANHPQVLLPSDLSGLSIRPLHRPQHLMVDQESVWLFRYRIIPRKLGDYEIPPFQVVDSPNSLHTKPLFLHVSQTGELPPLAPRELALGVNIPESLSEEVLKAAPQPTPRPAPSATPRDPRAFGERTASSCWHVLKSWWNYPGK